MKKAKKPIRVFDTDRRIRLGIWGLGRGLSFYNTCAALNIDVVAGCDYNAHMRDFFLQFNPKAFVTADADTFLKQDFDAVLLATFCPAHADDAIRCLKAGKHVLSEVTAFHTMAEGVRLVEAVEQSGLVYNLAENYPFTKANMYLARKWKEGLFGDLMYAEYEYVHEIRSLCYTYIDGIPVKPGNTVHNWRSWMNFHYYCTHSLGPIMVITGTRPTRVMALPGDQTLAGYLMTNRSGMGGITPSLIRMSNGAVVRNLMGATTNDTHIQRLWGTLGAAELNVGHELQLRLGASGSAPKFPVKPSWDALGQLAESTGHGGGDFWVLYYFARQILTNEPAPFDIYHACDVTIPGILAFRSSVDNGKSYDVPDFRNSQERDLYRNDHWCQKRYDVKNGVFPDGADKAITDQFTTVMADLIRYSLAYRAYRDWGKVRSDMAYPEEYLNIVARVAIDYDKLVKAYRAARKIIDAYPQSDGARVLSQMLEIGDEKAATAPGCLKQLKRQYAALQRQYPLVSSWLVEGAASALLPAPRDIRRAELPSKTVTFKPVDYLGEAFLFDIRKNHGGKDGLVYLKVPVRKSAAVKGRLLFGVDGPVKVWVNGTVAASEPAATNPAVRDQYSCPVALKKGANELVFAIHTNKGKAWGVIARIRYQE